MRKLLYNSLFCSVLLLLGHVPANAQINFGIPGSINIANVRDARFSTESITGYSAGAYANITIPNTHIGIQPEILYSQKDSSHPPASKIRILK